MVILIFITLIAVGLCLGSFVNAFVWRHYAQAQLAEERDALADTKTPAAAEKRQALDTRRAELSIVRGRSMCTHCKHPLAARDLIPVVSFLWLGGKCRYCGHKIEDSPLAELLTPLLFIISYVGWPRELQGMEWLFFVLWLLLLVGFVALVLYDLRWFLLPHSIVLPLIALAVVYVLLLATVGQGGVPVLVGAFSGAVLISGIFYLLYWISKEQWIGGGDVTLGFLLGLLSGGPAKALLLVFLASFIGTLIALPLLLLGRAGRGTRLPFGPLLILAGIIVVLFGDRIIRWYTGQFLAI
ncbi:MAG TPA: prepilin peptidase [Candidatus Saccharimonadales bacterium]|nr:prepilin peptidase [Candidatus Saccharimonadales bacterium]